jgi:hypothetical protein
MACGAQGARVSARAFDPCHQHLASPALRGEARVRAARSAPAQIFDSCGTSIVQHELGAQTCGCCKLRTVQTSALSNTSCKTGSRPDVRTLAHNTCIKQTICKDWGTKYLPKLPRDRRAQSDSCLAVANLPATGRICTDASCVVSRLNVRMQPAGAAARAVAVVLLGALSVRCRADRPIPQTLLPRDIQISNDSVVPTRRYAVHDMVTWTHVRSESGRRSNRAARDARVQAAFDIQPIDRLCLAQIEGMSLRCSGVPALRDFACVSDAHAVGNRITQIPVSSQISEACQRKKRGFRQLPRHVQCR